MAKPKKPEREFKARGRVFSGREVLIMQALVKRHYKEGRTRISEKVCRALAWRQSNGRLKDMACREVLRNMNRNGLIRLPPARTYGGAWRKTKPLPFEGSKTPIRGLSLDKLRIERVTDRAKAELWNLLIGTFHYLGSSRLVGRQMKYLVFSGKRPIACFGWGDAAWAVRARDEWIGWTSDERERFRERIINNVRFLILPWVRVKNLASHLLSRTAQCVVADWKDAYGVKPVLLETFVDPAKFDGTSYRAGNWVELGSTRGYAKHGGLHHNSQTPKKIFVFPVRQKFRTNLRDSQK